MRETTALGAAMTAGIAARVWKDIEELKMINREDPTIFQPLVPQGVGSYMYRRWERAVEMSRGWTEGANIA
jgi:glycerol kinase